MKFFLIGAYRCRDWDFKWYFRLSSAEQQIAEELAVGFAEEVYGKSLYQLTESEAKTVYDFVKGELT